MKYLLFVGLLFFTIVTQSQYTEIINSKRPGFSESPYGVGTKVFQVETGIFYQDNQVTQTFDTENSLGTNIFLRYGNFLEKLEFNLDFAYQKDERIFNNIINSFFEVNGVSRLTFGAKYLVYNQKYTDKSKEIRSWKKRTSFDLKRLIPSVGVYVGLNTNFLGESFKEERLSPKAAILLQNEITNRLNIISNLIADKIGQDNSEFSYIVTTTFALNEKWSIFAEHQGVFKKLTTDELQFGVGTAFLYTKNMQFDIAARANYVGNTTDIYVALGGSWRLDKHQKEAKSKDVLKGKKEGTFFSRLFKKNKNKGPKTRKIKIKKRKKQRAKKGTPSFHKKDKKG
ncbi:MAG: transporter [Flavobacteriaceae bacterium]|nr:transporter [Flavobacteriaceae bacterium]